MEEDAGESTVTEQVRSLPAKFAPASKSKFYFSSNSTPKNINKFQIENGSQPKCCQADASCCAWPLLALRPQASLITGLRRSIV